MLHMQRQTNTVGGKRERLTIQLTRVVARDTKHPFQFWEMFRPSLGKGATATIELNLNADQKSQLGSVADSLALNRFPVSLAPPP